ncbi:GDSL esterase/lipase 1-like [Mangifera indica]|uniref:GDSL esterase/lipase 1-like n=1 Tax=Mangifera indica TaxID=29780 RepID=UPI001CF98934|nr:GDSL esterase/lipase 1-like [Mangifera indica]
MSTLQYFLSFLVSFSSILIPNICHELDHRLPKNHVAFFIFGDSLFDAGMNNYINTTADFQANFWPYGETFFNYPTGRFSDGRLMPDFIAEYAKLPLIPTYLPYKNRPFVYGANFASGGAGALVESHQGYVVDLETQLSYFSTVEKRLKKKLGDAEAKTLLSKSVYLFSVGGNDYLVLFDSNSTYKYVLKSYKSKKEYVGMVIGNLTSAIKEIYMQGGRKFAFVNMLPLGCLPGVKILVPGNSGSCLEAALEMARLHNKELHKALKDLKSQLDGFKYANHDLYKSLGERINNPSGYGLKKATACCGIGPGRGNNTCGGKRANKVYQLCEDPGDYLFFDSLHPCEKANRQTAELLWSGIPAVTGAYNLKQLFELT